MFFALRKSGLLTFCSYSEMLDLETPDSSDSLLCVISNFLRQSRILHRPTAYRKTPPKINIETGLLYQYERGMEKFRIFRKKFVKNRKSFRNYKCREKKGVVDLKREEHNNLIRKYRNGCDESFTLLFESYKPLLKSLCNEFTEARNLPFSEMFSELSFCFWELVDEFNESKGAKFSGYIRHRLKRKALDFLKGATGSYYERVCFVLDYSDDTIVKLEPKTNNDYVEKQAEMKTRAEKLQLLDSLTKNTVPLTTTIVKEYMDSDDPKPYVIGKKLGVSSMKVTRELEKLSKRYNEEKFGDLYDYLAV